MGCEGEGHVSLPGQTVLDGITDAMDMSLSRLRGLVMDREAWRAIVHGIQRVGHD